MLVGVGTRVQREFRLLFRCGREAREVVGQAALERRGLRLRRGGEARGLQLGQHVAIDVAARPRGVLHGRWRRLLQRLPCPVLRAAAREVKDRLRGGRGRGFIGPRCALRDPRGDVRDYRVRQLARGRHLEIHIAIADGLHDAARVRIAGHQRRAVVTALEDRRDVIQPKRGLLLLRAVAGVAMLRQCGPHLALEEFERGRIRRLRAPQQCAEREHSTAKISGKRRHPGPPSRRAPRAPDSVPSRLRHPAQCFHRQGRRPFCDQLFWITSSRAEPVLLWLFAFDPWRKSKSSTTSAYSV